MANKRVTSKEDPLTKTEVYLPKSLKEALDNLSLKTGKSISALVREWSIAQVDSHAVELSKLCELERQKEAELKIIQSQKAELEDKIRKKQLATQGREELIRKQAEGLISSLKEYGDISKLEKAIKVRAFGINQKLNGTGAEPVKPEEIKQALITCAKAQGVRFYE
jgi:predicted DNA-binding protein